MRTSSVRLIVSQCELPERHLSSLKNTAGCLSCVSGGDVCICVVGAHFYTHAFFYLALFRFFLLLYLFFTARNLYKELCICTSRRDMSRLSQWNQKKTRYVVK